jgi:protein-S-isoprenylcysteine O-methyltransferase Ste14
METIYQKRAARGTVWAAVMFYSIIAFEFFYMATPFAAYFYSVYRPGLLLLKKIPVLQGSLGFFLPHLVETTQSSFINMLPFIGRFLFVFGLLTFVVCAIQVYWAKLFKKGVVSAGLYRMIRHPQYTAFAICGFGMLLLWPRYLVVIFYITVIFAYYLLARIEEKECLQKYGEDYSRYKANTFMFLPVRIPILKSVGKIPYLRNREVKILSIFLIYMCSILISLSMAHALKKISVRNLNALYFQRKAYISTYSMNQDTIRRIVTDIEKNLKVKKHLDSTMHILMVNYLLPADRFISEIPMEEPDSSGCHVFHRNYNATRSIKLIYTQVTGGKYDDNKPIKKLLTGIRETKPYMEVIFDTKTSQIVTVKRTMKMPRYKSIPEPIF